MKFQTRKERAEACRKNLETYINRRSVKLVHIRENTSNVRIRKKANRWIEGMTDVACKAMFNMQFINADMTDKEVINMVWKEQRGLVRLMRRHKLRLKGISGALGVDRMANAEPVIAKLKELRAERNKV